jgi:hypothetical protein
MRVEAGQLNSGMAARLSTWLDDTTIVFVVIARKCDRSRCFGNIPRQRTPSRRLEAAAKIVVTKGVVPVR